MTVTIDAPFQNRLRRIVRRHNRMVHGVKHKVNKDGLIVAKPRVYNPRFPLKGLLLLVAAAFVFKAFVYAEVGAGTYEARVAELGTGSVVEQAGAWVMSVDPATKFVGGLIGSALR